MPANKIYLKNSQQSGVVPRLSSLDSSELAVNLVDGKIFLKQTPVVGDSSQDRIISFSSSEDNPYTYNSSFSTVETTFGNNITYQVFGTTLGGLDNQNYGATATIVNGELNKIYSDFAFIGNGYNNAVYLSGNFSSILNGENNIIALSGNHSSILGGSNNRIDHPNTFILGSDITTVQANCTYVNRLFALSGIEIGGSKQVSDLYISDNGNVGIKTETPNVELTVEGSISGRNIYADYFHGNGSSIENINAYNITSGTLNAARLPTFNGDITTTVNGTVSATVVAIQGEPISTQTPNLGQVLQWTGTSWTPGAITTGGSGGGGLVYYLNFANQAQAPTTNLPATPNTPRELGSEGTITSSSVTKNNVSQINYDLICGFVSLTGSPSTVTIPAGLWDFNIWASATSTVTNQTSLLLNVYKYSASNTLTLLASSGDIFIYDPITTAQYIASVVFPQTTLLETDRIYIEITAKATQNNKNITIYFGGTTPTHVHTTFPSVGGSGLVKVINGVYQSPASLLVNTDVAANAAIDQSKINGLTDVANKANSAYTTVQAKSATEWDNALANSYTRTYFLPLSGGTMTGKLTAAADTSIARLNIGNALVGPANPSTTTDGDLWINNGSRLSYKANSNIYTLAPVNTPNTFTSTQIIDLSSSTATALRVTQRGLAEALRIEDETNPDNTPFIVDNIGNVGIGIGSLSGTTQKLTIVGNISATGVLTVSGGNSNLWNSAYTTVQSNSATTWNYQGTDLKDLSANWQSTYSTVSSLSSNWGSVYTTTQTNSANWQTAYAYVSANSVNLTATNIFVNNNLTVTNTVSAKYYQGTLLDWMTLVRGYKTTPTLLATIGTGEVYTYVFATTGTDKTYYRYIATDGSEDSFYENFTNPTLSNLIAKKAIIL
jgi:hypothetical protein